MINTPVVASVSAVSPLALGVESIYGYYLVDRETFLELKRQHKQALAYYKELRRYYRYYRKQPENRPTGDANIPFSSLTTSENSNEVRVTVATTKKMYLNLLRAYQMARKCYKEVTPDIKKDFNTFLVLSSSPLSHGLPAARNSFGGVVNPTKTELGIAPFLYMQTEKKS